MPPNPIKNEGKKSRVRELLRMGRTYQQIANELHCSLNFISAIKREMAAADTTETINTDILPSLPPEDVIKLKESPTEDYPDHDLGEPFAEYRGAIIARTQHETYIQQLWERVNALKMNGKKGILELIMHLAEYFQTPLR